MSKTDYNELAAEIHSSMNDQRPKIPHEQVMKDLLETLAQSRFVDDLGGDLT